MNLKCLFGHQWNDSCKCERCGEIRDERHNWVTLEGKCEEKCSICGKERDVEHKFVIIKGQCKEKCSVCGVTYGIKHKYKDSDGKCEICGSLDPDRAYRDIVSLFHKGGGDRLFADYVKEDVRKIGKALDEAGGIVLMRKVGMRFAENYPLGARHLETTWDGIGTWQG